MVDYIIASQSLLNSVSFFQVHDFMGDLSDHCQLSMSLKVHCNLFPNQKKRGIHMSEFPRQHQWNESSAEIFLSTIKCADIQTKLIDLEHHETKDPNYLLSIFNEILLNTADKCLKLKKVKIKQYI